MRRRQATSPHPAGFSVLDPRFTWLLKPLKSAGTSDDPLH
ncbi:hypothetical protein X741_03890 [Mesorhizobium sp. LNHC229A00]|nr:hypothetical protein X741_03890 [Mesorhizobium sp. LNHC229A00]